MSGEPLFSVVVAVHNGAATMQRCIDSVAGQVDAACEMVVMDGGSSDDTVEILERNDDRIASWRSEPDRGICHAWNKALELARGEWILVLGADDALAAPDTLTRAAALLGPLDDAISIAYGRVDLVDEQGNILGEDGRPWSEASIQFHSHNTIPHQGVFHRRSLFNRYGPFDERFRYLGDYELLVRVLREHDPFFLDITISRFQLGGISNLDETLLATTREAYRARYVNGLERLPESIAPRVWRARGFDLVRRTFGMERANKLADLYHRR